jgi:hypothetical protein
MKPNPKRSLGVAEQARLLSGGFGGFKRRDNLVCAVCNFLLRHVASRNYRRAIEGSVRYGLQAAARDAHNAKGHVR